MKRVDVALCAYGDPTPLWEAGAALSDIPLDVVVSSFCEACLATFSRDGRREVVGETTSERAMDILTRYADEWALFKCESIARFCAEARQVIREAAPETRVADIAKRPGKLEALRRVYGEIADAG